jgi:hypothetical protein
VGAQIDREQVDGDELGEALVHAAFAQPGLVLQALDGRPARVVLVRPICQQDQDQLAAWARRPLPDRPGHCMNAHDLTHMRLWLD